MCIISPRNLVSISQINQHNGGPIRIIFFSGVSTKGCFDGLRLIIFLFWFWRFDFRILSPNYFYPLVFFFLTRSQRPWNFLIIALKLLLTIDSYNLFLSKVDGEIRLFDGWSLIPLRLSFQRENSLVKSISTQVNIC